MIRLIAPQFFTMDIPGTLAYYKKKLGFECLGTWQDPPVYAIVARDRHAIHFRCAEPPAANPDKYADEPMTTRSRRLVTNAGGASPNAIGGQSQHTRLYGQVDRRTFRNSNRAAE
jgi:hypothetical protein